MPSPTPDSRLKAAVSVSEMARMCNGLSRSRFYELVKTGFMPGPSYDPVTRRPVYTHEQQELCLRVRATNVGVNGRFILFYTRRAPPPPAPARRCGRRSAAREGVVNPSLVETLRSLGMVTASEADVADALRACFPSGTGGADEGTVVRSVFRHLRRSGGA